MLQDYKPQLDTPKRQGRLALVYIQATFSSGVATVDTDRSSPRVTMVKSATGRYAITFPKSQFVHWVGGSLDPAADDPTDTNEQDVSPRSLNPANGGTGTGSVLFRDTDVGDLQDPRDGTRCYITLLVGGN